MLNKKQQMAWNTIVHDKGNVYVGGPGGMGKSYLTNVLRENFPDTLFLAPTGIAALNIEGSTIHKVFMFPFGMITPYQKSNISDKTRELFKDGNINRIVLDEVSMVRADVMDAMDHQLRKIMRNDRPFGGIQIVTVGDFFQLPPVLNKNSREGQAFMREYDSPYCFDCDAWRNAGFRVVELTEAMRQSDEKFISVLQSIRQKDENFKESVNYINTMCLDNENVSDDATVLCTTNKNANMVNSHNYDDIEGEEYVFHASKTGDFREEPAPEELRLKIGAKVLVTANQGDAINGMTGYVSQITSDMIYVETERYGRLGLEKHKWESFDYTKRDDKIVRDVVGTYKQFPLKLGYAITIHKSQGMTLDEAIIYMGNGAFTHGQTYVALSRLRSIEGLRLMSPIRYKDVIVDDEVKEFYSERVGNDNLMNMV